MFEPYDPIAITGIGLRFPGASDVTAFWRLLCDGTDAVTRVPENRWSVKDRTFVQLTEQERDAVNMGGFIDHIDRFDAPFFGISAKEAVSLDPKQRLVLETTWQALEDAGVRQADLQGSETGVYVGTSVYDYYQLLTRDVRNVDSYLGTGNFNCIVANRVSYFLDLKGPSLAVETACSASLTAVQLACQAIWDGSCVQAFAGGAMVMLAPEVSESFAMGGFLASDGHCKAFSDDADGYVRGEGAAMVLLKPLSKALQDNDRVYATILSAVCNQDGRSNGLTAPNPLAQQALLKRAYEKAGVSPSDIMYVETHGTGTRLGDPMELKSLGSILNQRRDKNQPCRVGSVKTNIGHLEAAAGIAGLIKTALCVYHSTLPPSLHYAKPNSFIPFEKLGLKVQQTLEPWPEGGVTRLAAVSSFSFGGSNAHVVVQQAPNQCLKTDVNFPEILTLSMKTEGRLPVYLDSIKQHFNHFSKEELCNAAYSLNCRRTAFRFRSAVLLDVDESGSLSWEDIDANESSSSKPIVAFLFSGQGAQYAGMVEPLYNRFEVFQEAFDLCAGIMKPYLDDNLLRICKELNDSKIDCTRYTQPALFAMEYAIAKLWMSWGVRPAAMLGHSVGEITAACIAGVLDLESASKLICMRAGFMAELPEGGGMLAVFESLETLSELLDLYQDLSIAAINGERHIVVSGSLESIDRLTGKLESKQIESKRLPVSHAFHSAMLEPMLERFQKAIDFPHQLPQINIISNVTGEPANATTYSAEYWTRHAREPVMFAQGVNTLLELKVDTVIQIGPGQNLLTLSKLCKGGENLLGLASLRRSKDAGEILRSLGKLYISGYQVDWEGYYAGQNKHHMSLPHYPFERTRYWMQYEQSDQVYGVKTLNTSYGAGLLGNRLLSASEDIIYSLDFGAPSFKYLHHHKVFDRPVLPAAAGVEILLSAIYDLSLPCSGIDRVQFLLPINLDESNGVLTQLVVKQEQGGSFQASVFRFNSNHQWELCIKASISNKIIDIAKAYPLQELKKKFTESVDISELYRVYKTNGIEYGPLFQVIQKAYKKQSEVLAKIELTEIELNKFNVCHPVLLDGCLQSIAALGLSECYVPSAMGHIVIDQFLPGVIWSHVVLTSGSDGADRINANLTLYRENGEVIACVNDIHLSKINAAKWQRVDACREHFYAMGWERCSQYSLMPFEKLAFPLSHEFIQQQSTTLAEQLFFEEYRSGLDKLEEVCASIIANVMQNIFGDGLIDFKAWQNIICNTYGEYTFNRYMQILMQYDYVNSITNSGYKLKNINRKDDAGALKKLAIQVPSIASEAELVNLCGEALESILKGDSDPIPVLFSSKGQTCLTNIYREGCAGQYFGKMIRKIVCRILKQVPEGIGIRILEIGAGTGGTTAYLAPILSSASVQYTFTDISNAFLESAKSSLGGYEFIEFDLLNIEHCPLKQGYRQGQFDIIIASNILHATSDLDRSLRHIQSLLSNYGVVLIQELTKAQAWLDITFGLTNGWWLFSDQRCNDGYPLLNKDAWFKTLQENNFGSCQALSPPNTMYQHIIVAHKKPNMLLDVDTGQSWLILNSDTAMGAELLAYADAQELSFQAISRTELNDTGEHRYQTVFNNSMGTSGVSSIFLMFDENQHAGAGYSQLLACRFLFLIQAILSQFKSELPRIFLVTQNAIQVTPGDDAANYAQAALWGMARTLTQEYPQLSLLCIDKDGSDIKSQLTLLLSELSNGCNTETQIAYRSGIRLVARLKNEQSFCSAIKVPCEPVRLKKSIGNIDSICLQQMKRFKPRAGQIEIRVDKSALNFIDLLDCLDSLPFERPAGLGAECIGTVTALADSNCESAKSFELGQRVLSITPGCMAEYVIADAALTVSIPDEISDADAAALGVSYLTAYQALYESAKIKPGESVLVHAAAGATGFAAACLARYLGATVYVTSSPEKWPLLKTYGFEYCFHSRNHSFSDDILSVTGGRGVDVVINSLTSNGFIQASLDCLSANGRFVELAKNNIYSHQDMKTTRADIRYSIVDLYQQVERRDGSLMPALQRMLDEIAENKLPRIPVSVYSVINTAAALRHFQQALHVGKIVIDWQDSLARARSKEFLKEDATYLITGGLGGLGLLFAEWMFDRGAGKIYLFARSQPNSKVSQKIQNLRDKGANICVEYVDVTNKVSFVNSLNLIKQREKIAGIIHSVGVLDDGVVESQNKNKILNVMAPKVLGAEYLVEACHDVKLDFFVLFSSVAGLFGSAGQCNHAAANTVLNSYAGHLRANGLPVISIDWGTWSEIGAAASRGADDRFARSGINAITPQLGKKAFEYALGINKAHTAFIPIDWHKATDSAMNFKSPVYQYFHSHMMEQNITENYRGENILLTLSELPDYERVEYLTGFIKQQVGEVLGFNQAQIDLQQGFTDIGIDSLTSIELRNRLQNSFSLKLPSTLLFDYPNVETLCDYLMSVLVFSDNVAESETESFSIDLLAEKLADKLEMIDTENAY